MSVFAFSPKRRGAIGGSLLAVLLLFLSGWMGSGWATAQEGPDGHWPSAPPGRSTSRGR